MRPFQSVFVAVPVAALLRWTPTVAVTSPAPDCAPPRESTLPADWNPRSMAGEYRVEWVSDAGSQRHTSRFHVILWKTSMLDSSRGADIRPALLLRTVGNRRDGVMVLDGAGLGAWIRQASDSGLSGSFEPWGIISDDEGRFCARRVSP